VPRRDLSRAFFGAALAGVVLLLMARSVEMRSWA
jgi:hypothetical protein